VTARFGPAGRCSAAEHIPTVQAPEWLAQRGLNAFEVQFGRGVSMGEKTARKLGESAAGYDIALSVHAPYYISLSSAEPESREKNLRYIRQSAAAADWMGATRVVVHAGSAKQDRDAALTRAFDTLKAALDMLEELSLPHIQLCPETMGKINQLGDLDEVITLCAAEPRLHPCIDFGHLYARCHGELKTEDDYAAVLDRLEAGIGRERARKLHVHFSQIEYSKGGEVRHLKYGNGQFGPDFAPLAALFAKRGYNPTVICESDGTQAEDAALMRDLYQKCKSG
jgi:deoxyribonuclease-4